MLNKIRIGHFPSRSFLFANKADKRRESTAGKKENEYNCSTYRGGYKLTFKRKSNKKITYGFLRVTASLKAEHQLPLRYTLKFARLFCTLCVLYYFGWRAFSICCIHFPFLSVAFLEYFPLVRNNRPDRLFRNGNESVLLNRESCA